MKFLKEKIEVPPLTKKIIYAVVLLVICYLQFKSCKAEKEYRDFSQTAELKFKENNAKLLDAKEQIYRGDVIITENNKYIQHLIDTIKHLKQPRTITRVVIKTQIDTIFIPHEVQINVLPDGSKWLEVPLKFSKSNEWYAIQGIIETHGMRFDSLSYKNDFYIATGTEDHGNWFKNTFKRNETVIQLKDNNPYSVTKTLHQTILNSKKNRFHLILGGGYGLNNSWSVGAYAGYSIISF